MIIKHYVKTNRDIDRTPYKSLFQAVWVFSLIDYEPPTYHNGEYKYPWWAEAIGWGIASLSLICIPAFAIYEFIRANGNTCAEVR